MKANKFAIAATLIVLASVPALARGNGFAGKSLTEPPSPSIGAVQQEKQKAPVAKQKKQNQQEQNVAPEVKRLKDALKAEKISKGDWILLTTTLPDANYWMVKYKNKFFNWRNTELLPVLPLPTQVVGRYWGFDEGRQSIIFGGWANMPKKALRNDFFWENNLQARQITSVIKLTEGQPYTVYYLDRSGRNSVEMRSGKIEFGTDGWNNASIRVHDQAYGDTTVPLNDMLFVQRN